MVVSVDVLSVVVTDVPDPVLSVEVSVVVELMWQKPQVKSHMCMAGQVGQNVTSQSPDITAHTSMQSASLKQVVVLSVVKL